jgi:dienelactone hydrolase
MEDAMKTQDIEYTVGGVTYVGTLKVDDAKSGKRPGVLVAHEGGGLTDHARNIAGRLAQAGYVAFALDYYGGGKPLADLGQAMPRIMAFMAEPQGIRDITTAALKVLADQPETDASKLAGIGYCFGGTTVLELARSGADVKATVGFHSGLSTARPDDAKNIKGKVLVQIGRDDPIIPPEQRIAFEDEMSKGKVDWRMMVYGNAGHSFTNPDVGAMGREGFAYDKSADERSWRAMLDLFNEAFGAP